MFSHVVLSATNGGIILCASLFPDFKKKSFYTNYGLTGLAGLRACTVGQSMALKPGGCMHTRLKLLVDRQQRQQLAVPRNGLLSAGKALLAKLTGSKQRWVHFSVRRCELMLSQRWIPATFQPARTV